MNLDQSRQSSPPPPPPPAPPIQGDKPFSVSFDGSALTGMLNVRSLRDFDRLMKVLAAQRTIMEAIEDDAVSDDEA